jgi:glyoxylase-like metal-dependent hydrolase (beta-lactamase superfamily II)
MRTLALDVHELRGVPPHALNVYLVGDVLVDAGTTGAHRRIVRELAVRQMAAHVVTHAHPDHYGSSHAVCEQLGLPLWAGERDADAVEAGSVVLSPTRVGALLSHAPMPPGHPVARRLREGDAVGAGFSVLDVPGHSPGHIALWREADRTLIAGDVFFNLPRLGAPPRFMSFDPDANRASMRRLAELRPALVLFGHGPPLRDPERLARAAAR